MINKGHHKYKHGRKITPKTGSYSSIFQDLWWNSSIFKAWNTNYQIPVFSRFSRICTNPVTDSANECHVFGGHFNQKSLARTPTWDRQFVQISVLSSGDQQAICHAIETDEPRDCGKPTPSLVTFVSRHQGKSHVLCLFNPRSWRTERFLVWTNE